MSKGKVEFPFSPSGKPIVTVRFTGPRNRRTYEALVDTGADLSVISEKMARRLGYDAFDDPPDGKITGFGGDEVPYWNILVKICLTNGVCELEWEAEIGVVKLDLKLAYLGRKGCLDLLRVTFDPKPNRLTFEADDGFPGDFRQ